MVREAPGDTPWSLAKLPAFPPVANQLLFLMSDPDVALPELAALISRDPALAAEVLRQVNSAAFARRGRIDSVSHAVILLGLDRLRAMTITVAIMASYMNGSVKNQMLARCWRHSLAAALIAQATAGKAGVAQDTAYAAALLHDLGRLALVVSYPAEYANLLRVTEEHGFDLVESERQLFDIDHCQAGAWIADRWGFPGVFAEAALNHHARAGVTQSGIVGVVRFSCEAAHGMGYSATDRRSEAAVEDLGSLFQALTGSGARIEPRDLRELVEARI